MDNSTKTILVWPHFLNCCLMQLLPMIFQIIGILLFFKLLQFYCNCYAYSPQKNYPYKTYQVYTFLMQRLSILFNVILKYFVNSKHMFTLNINLIHIIRLIKFTLIYSKSLKNLYLLFFYIAILVKISYHFSKVLKIFIYL